MYNILHNIEYIISYKSYDIIYYTCCSTPNNNNTLHHHLQGRRLNLRTSLVVQHETQLGHALTKMHNPHAEGGGSGDTTKPGNYYILRH